jgi:DNA-binding transcriptional ArsR family regulator
MRPRSLVALDTDAHGYEGYVIDISRGFLCGERATPEQLRNDLTSKRRTLDVCKALANPTRLQIMGWLRDPAEHFATQTDPIEQVGVCVKQIQEKAGISQSTASQFMAVLQRAGLVESTGSASGPTTAATKRGSPSCPSCSD